MKSNAELCLPNLIIAGVPKAATTSFYTYLASHPEVYGSGKKEIHYFTPIIRGKPLKDISWYKKFFEKRKDEKYAVDASPAYFFGGRQLIEKMKEALPLHKVIVILRNPVDRFISHYNQRAAFLASENEGISEFIRRCLQEAPNRMENKYSRLINFGRYIDFVPEWIEAYGNDIKFIYFEELISRPKEAVMDVADWLRIDKQPFMHMQYTNENRTVRVENKSWHAIVKRFYLKNEIFFRRNKWCKAFLRDAYYKLNYKKKEKNRISEEDRLLLKSYYKESNKELGTFLLSRNMQLPTWLKHPQN